MSRHLLFEQLEPRRLFDGASTHFAVIGDFGSGTQDEADVATLVKSWNPDYIVTVGDNNYPAGGADTIDPHIGQFYHEYIYNYSGDYGAGSPTPRFFPTLGNHDWGDQPNNPDGADPYKAFFSLPSNERYYDFVQGPVHFFIVDSDQNEPDGYTASSVQGQWLQNGLAAATEPHKVVFFHHAAYSSSSVHGSNAWMQWPFQQWGATAVFSGHDHDYERLSVGGLPYFVDGPGGSTLYGFGAPETGSQFRYSAEFGAMLVDADATTMTTRFYNVQGQLIDQYTINTSSALANVSINAIDGSGSETGNDPIVFAVNRAGNTTGDLLVRFAITGTATNGVDYATIPGSVIIPAGQDSANVTIVPIDDNQPEGAETVTLTIIPDPAYNAVPSLTATGIITDDGTGNTPTTPLPGNSVWKYLVTPTTPQNWTDYSFNDSAWPSGRARLGFGDPGMSTIIGYGPDPGNKYITTYFRSNFTVNNPGAVETVALNLICDDGAAIYLNGLQVARVNMPDFPPEITWSTLASTDIDGDAENTWISIPIPIASLLAGNNVLAVEVHQSAPDSSDLGFDMSVDLTLNASAPQVASTGFRYVTGPQAVQFTFNTDVSASLAAGDLLLTNLTSQSLVNASSVLWDGVTKTASFVFIGAFPGGVLPDGRYHAVLPPGTVTDGSGNPIIAGAAFDFFFLQGDANHDARCDSTDFNILATNFGILSGRNFTQADFSYDGAVDSADFNVLARQFGKSLPGGAARASGSSGGSGNSAYDGLGDGASPGGDSLYFDPKVNRRNGTCPCCEEEADEHGESTGEGSANPPNTKPAGGGAMTTFSSHAIRLDDDDLTSVIV